jgi:flagellar basal-body rod protein FlgG
MRALYSAAQGMKAQQINLDTISNNLSNVNTTGFKKTRVEFKDLLYEQITRSNFANDEGRPTAMEVGNGVALSATLRSFTGGSFTQTQNSYDLAIDGEGFFKIKDENNNIFFTRDGSFKTSVTSEGVKLVTSEGFYLQGESGDIILGADVAETSISRDGEIRVKRTTGIEESIGLLQLVKFSNPAGLESKGSNLFAETEASGQATSPADGTAGSILQGMLETSNVQVVEEMINLITAQRAYEMSSKVIQTADQMSELANNLKR